MISLAFFFPINVVLMKNGISLQYLKLMDLLLDVSFGNILNSIVTYQKKKKIVQLSKCDNV